MIYDLIPPDHTDPDLMEINRLINQASTINESAPGDSATYDEPDGPLKLEDIVLDQDNYDRMRPPKVGGEFKLMLSRELLISPVFVSAARAALHMLMTILV